MSRRTDRLASIIQQELGMMILRELNDPRLVGLPSVTRVKVAEDLSVANVYISVMGTPGQQTAALNALRHSAGLMRTRLTKALTIRQVPFLQFNLDEDLKKELELLSMLQKVEQENAELDRKRAAEGGGDAPPQRMDE
jgi:ribosome-binding factor A